MSTEPAHESAGRSAFLGHRRDAEPPLHRGQPRGTACDDRDPRLARDERLDYAEAKAAAAALKPSPSRGGLGGDGVRERGTP